MERGRILALDLGGRRVGLALSDPLGLTAQPLGFFERQGASDVDTVARLVATHRAERVVVGHPLLLSGVPGEKARDAETMVEALRGRLASVDVVLWDERLTTVQAERAMIAAGVRRKRRRERADSVAAALILQSYLDAMELRPDPRGSRGS